VTEVIEGPAAPGEPDTLTAQVGASSFSDLVRAHFQREEERSKGHAHKNGADGAFAEKLQQFEQEEGKLAAVYWSTRNASAVALTVGTERHKRNPIADTDAEVRLHRVTDWVAKGAEPIAELLHECDVLAIRVREVLRGTSERIAMQWLYSIQEHALGFLERRDRRDLAKERAFVRDQRHELARIEQYYLRTGAKAGRIVYVSGMVAAAAFIVTVCAGLAIGLSFTSLWGLKVEALLLCAGAGSVGALVSVLSRMSLGDDEFSIDFEVGRPLLRRLGLYKPFVGSVFSVATYFLVAGGLLPSETSSGDPLFFYGILGFLAGFSERFTGVIFGNAQSLIGGTAQSQAAPQSEAPSDGAAPTEPDLPDAGAAAGTG
jgi:gluconate kinase